MGQTEYKQQNSFRNRLNIIDTLVGQAAKTEIESISAAYLIQANQEINLLELKYGSELTIQQNLYKVKVAFLQMNRLILNNLPFKIVDYNFTLNANMRGGDFNGYSATGLKLLVTKIEPVEESK